MKTVLITGASAGIGRATARLFASKGWQVAATMRKPERETELAKVKNIRLYKLDVTESEQQVSRCVDAIVDNLKHIDALVNNAGIGVFGAFESADFELIQRQIETNVLGLMRVTKATLPHMRTQGAGVIVNVSSAVGRVSFPVQSLYNTTKFAVEGFSESLQYELRPLGIRVKVVQPGSIKTEFFNSLIVAKDDDLPEYHTYQEKVLANLRSLNAGGSSARKVARVIFRATRDRSDRLRYIAGGDARLLLKMRKVLPDGLFFNLIRNLLEK